MPRMRAVDVTDVFGLRGAAINPFYSAVKRNGTIRLTLARHV